MPPRSAIVADPSTMLDCAAADNWSDLLRRAIGGVEQLLKLRLFDDHYFGLKSQAKAGDADRQLFRLMKVRRK
jgi:hypothetical protein